MPNTWVFIGRFQPFHAGHLSIVTKILSNHDRMTLVIGSSEKSETQDNPWSLQEREAIIRASIPLELQERIDIVWLPDVPDDDIWCENLTFILPPDTELFTGNKWVQDICVRHGIPTQWIVPTIDISSTRIREMLRQNEDVSNYTIVKSLPLI